MLDRLTETNAHNLIAIDESLFTHKEGKQVWIVGLINLNTNEIRLEVVEDRSENTMEIL